MWYYSTVTWYRQRKPYKLPLSYSKSVRQVLSNTNSTYQQINANSDSTMAYNPSGSDASAYNKAYSSFRSKCYESASLSVSLAERKQSMNMISTRASQLFRFTRELKRLRFDKAAAELGLTKIPGSLWNRKGPKALAHNWLEFHFGWRPLINDIYDCSKVLSSSIPIEKIRASGSSSAFYSIGPDANGVTNSFRAKSRCSIQAQIRFDNPNLGLATQLGLTNPAVVAWELVPFSFVVDWFVNVGDFLQSFTDFAGFSFLNPQRTTVTIIDADRIGKPPGTSFQAKTRSVAITRSVGSIPGPTLRVRDPWVISPTRAITSISLLLQRLPK